MTLGRLIFDGEAAVTLLTLFNEINGQHYEDHGQCHQCRRVFPCATKKSLLEAGADPAPQTPLELAISIVGQNSDKEYLGTFEQDGMKDENDLDVADTQKSWAESDDVLSIAPPWIDEVVTDLCRQEPDLMPERIRLVVTRALPMIVRRLNDRPCDYHHGASGMVCSGRLFHKGPHHLVSQEFLDASQDPQPAPAQRMSLEEILATIEKVMLHWRGPMSTFQLSLQVGYAKPDISKFDFITALEKGVTAGRVKKDKDGYYTL